VSWNGPLLIPSATRLQGIFFWDLIIYVIEGFVFLLTGLQARTLIEQAPGFSLRELGLAAAVTTAMVVAARFVWVYPATYLPRWLSPALRKRDPSPAWSWVFILGFTGVRGVVSLAAALAIPLTLANGQPFPDRDLILFITFGVIIFTLVGLGLMLPAVVRWLDLGRAGADERRRERNAELAARRDALDAGLHRLETLTSERSLPDDIAGVLKARADHRRQLYPTGMDNADEVERAALNAKLRLELITAEREFLFQLLREGTITDESRRRIERELDLEEASIFCKQDADEPPL
jgi:CPA1 family monovalent cation:H+ antiporter